MSSRLQEMTKEAIASALYSMDFTRFLGEQPDHVTATNVIWFRLSNTPEVEHVDWKVDPRFMMVSIQEDVIGLVTVECSCINVSAGTDSPLRVKVPFRIPTTDVPEHHLHDATEQVVLRVLELFKDVLAQTGIAGPIEDLAPESYAGDEDDENDMAVKD
jgi:hypothetical protein